MNISPSERPITSKGQVIVGENVWIGRNTAILANVTIGKGTIIAANSVVNNSLPSYVLAAGCPARIVKTLVNNE